jgi:hypothetical protein
MCIMYVVCLKYINEDILFNNNNNNNNNNNMAEKYTLQTG